MKTIAVTLALFSVALAANLPIPTPVHQSSVPVPTVVSGNSSNLTNVALGNSSLPVNSTVVPLPLPANGVPSTPVPIPVPGQQRSGRYLILSNGNLYDRVSDVVIPSGSSYYRQIYSQDLASQVYQVQGYPVYQGRNYYRTVYY